MNTAIEKIFVTRPGASGQELVSELKNCGFETHALAVIKIESLSDFPIPWDNYDKVIVTSAHAAQAIPEVERPPARIARKIQWLAVGTASAKAMEQTLSGAVEIPSPKQQSSEGLLELAALKCVEAQRILVLKGEGGRPLLQDTLKARGAEVSSRDLYRRVSQEVSEQSLQWLKSCNNALIIVTSLEIFERLQPILKTQENRCVRIQFLTSSQRIAQAIEDQGYRTTVCQNASNQCLVASVCAHHRQ